MPLHLKYFTSLFFWLAPLQLIAGDVDHWETIIQTGSSCKYLVPGTTVNSAWISANFDDSAWKDGPGGIGYGDGDDGTTIDQSISVYCRYHFEIADPGVISALLVDVDFDDGFVVYLNGEEMGRFNMGESGSSTSWNQTAADYHEASLYQEIEPFRVTPETIILENLVAGDNVLAIQVHNQAETSSDLSSNVFLHAGINTSDRLYSETPEWFNPPFPVDRTILPLMIIDSEGQEIPDDPRVSATMGLINNGEGNYNSVGDPFNEYDGKISIETRGESSQWFYPKKSYSIETQTINGDNNNVSMLGLPAENDFVLYGPFGDKSLIRNVITYRLFERFGHYSPRTRLIELVVNDDYKGLYVLTEKIKRDKNRVDIAKIIPKDTTSADISGGYILRVDKTSGMDPAHYWQSTVQPPVQGHNPVIYQFFDPDYDELTSDQRNYVKGYLTTFEQAMASSSFTNPSTGYRAYLDIPSFLDLMILNEFAKDVDGFRLSHYFYKQKDSNGGKLVNGPPWDYNLTYGNSDYTTDIHETYNWTYDLGISVYWWARAMQDPWFRNQLYCRWDQLYETVLDPSEVTTLIDTTLMKMDGAIDRNFQRWPILGEYWWPNSFVGQNYDEEETYLRNWIDDRLSWIDGKWGGLCVPTSVGGDEVIPLPGTIKVYPNPSDLSRVFVSLSQTSVAGVSIKIYDVNGRVVFQTRAYFSGNEFAYELPDLSFLPDGYYTLEVTDGLSLRELSKLVKQ